MKHNIFLLLILFPLLNYSQEKWTFQPDSIYKKNNVKFRKWYDEDKLVETTYFDKEGRKIKHRLEPFIGGKQVTTYYGYSADGKLIMMVDTIINNEANIDALNELKDIGIDLTNYIDKEKPKLEVSKYELYYENDNLTKVTKFNPDGTIYLIDYYENNGKRQIREWYRNEKIYRVSTTVYLNEFQRERFYGWVLISNSEKDEWNYTYGKYKIEDGKLKQFSRINNGIEMETYTFKYNEKGLLIKVKYYTTERFEYEYF